ncbi:MAG TPA: hypothetical protein PLS22_13950 [Aquabacterium sp.]|nr:hypothetical protein [Aquabacterium sp.]
MTFRSLPLSWVRAGLMAATLSLSVPAVQAAGPSDLSAVPVAVSVTAPSGFFAGSAMLVMVSVEASAEGAVCVIERVSDGARMTLNVSGKVVKGASNVSGTAVVATAISTGMILSAAGEVIAFVPNALGKALFHDERVTR